MYRESPFWYKRHYTQVCAAFASAFREPEGCTYILPSYSNPVFENDGIHLSEDDGPKLVYDFPRPFVSEMQYNTL